MNRANVFITITMNTSLGWVVQLFHCIMFFVLSHCATSHMAICFFCSSSSNSSGDGSSSSGGGSSSSNSSSTVTCF